MTGAVIAIGYHGDVEIERGLVRSEDKAALRRSSEQAGLGDQAPSPVSSLSSSLIESLTAERTAALRAVMIDNEAVALAALCHALALPVFYGPGERAASCLDIRLVSRDLVRSAGEIETGGAMVLLAGRQADWQKRVPAQAADLFGWLLQQDMATLISLLSFCAALGIDAVRGKQERCDSERLRHADELAAALGLDMALWWTPTKANYLGRVSKTLILEAVSEGFSPQAAENLSGLKKDLLAARAEQKLSGRGWLPPLLRAPKQPEPEMAFEAMAAE